MKEIIEQHRLWLNVEGGKRADLTNVDLRFADLRFADLRFADFSGSDLTGADLTNTNFTDADLSYVDFTDANLNNTNLTNAGLFNAIGNGKEIRTFQTEFYTINITKDVIWIGCKTYTRDEWLAFTDEEISAMDEDALEFWNKYKPLITSMEN